MSNTPKKEWEKEFDREFCGILQDDGGLGKKGDVVCDLDGFLPPHKDLNDIKRFISSLLTSRDEALIAGLEEKKMKVHPGWWDGKADFNEGIDEAISLIRGSREV